MTEPRYIALLKRYKKIIWLFSATIIFFGCIMIYVNLNGFENINKRFDKQDSINESTNLLMERVPKIFPAPGAKITSTYGMRDSVMHWGIDISRPKGSPIYAMVTGKVTEAQWKLGYGYCTTMDSGIFKVKVAHQDKMYVAKNQMVKQGQLIGTVGSTGNSSGPHEHIEIEQDGKHRNPIVFF
jgi:murein DD-endopeptidase MepM/ murein hydrolase activator NlpD